METEKENEKAAAPTRYNSFTIALHWIMAIGFIVMLCSGFFMSYFEMDKSLKFQIYQWHKSGGVLLLLAVAVRVISRIISIVLGHIPPLPKHFATLEKIASKLGHVGLYALMIAMPISGWIMVSSSVYGLPTIVFDTFEWPHIPGIQGNEEANSLSKQAHFYLALIFTAMIATHIAAVIKHAFCDNENLLRRMWWTKK